MGTIIDSLYTKKLSQLKKPGKTLVLVGGCFDILHAGHIEFLKKAKELGDILIVMLESDARIRQIKGKDRPVNSLNHRATILANLPAVSFVLNLTNLQTDKDYEILVKSLQPDIIALSGSDKIFEWEKRLETEGVLKIIKIMDRIKNHSTTNLIGRIIK